VRVWAPEVWVLVDMGVWWTGAGYLYDGYSYVTATPTPMSWVECILGTRTHVD